MGVEWTDANEWEDRIGWDEIAVTELRTPLVPFHTEVCAGCHCAIRIPEVTEVQDAPSS